MKNYIYANLWTQELEDAIERSPTKPLVEEMFYKYGFKVMAIEELKNQYNWDTNKYEDIELADNFIITTDGYPLASLFTKSVDGTITYGIYSPRIAKERGSDDRDRRSFTSVKLSQLMKTLEKRKVVDDIERQINTVIIPRIVERVADMVDDGSRSKHIGYSEREKMESVHAFMKAYINNQPIESLPKSILEVSKELVDLFDKVDENTKAYFDRVRELFSNFYLLYSDANDGIVISKHSVEIKTEREGLKISSIDETVGATRLMNLEDHEDFGDFGGVFTMFKVYLQEQQGKQEYRIHKDMFPIVDKHFKDFDISTYYRNTVNQFEGVYLCIPASK